jgi:GNAT superfamily N-acetyltransferase
MIIRQATLLDLLPIAPLAERYALEAQGHSNFTFNLEEALKNAALTILDESGCFLVAYEDLKPVGFLWGSARALPWSKDKLAFDTILYTVPERRKTALGYKLMKSWEDWAREHNAVEVQISIASGITEDSTISFFKKMGYHYIGQQYRKET